MTISRSSPASIRASASSACISGVEIVADINASMESRNDAGSTDQSIFGERSTGPGGASGARGSRCAISGSVARSAISRLMNLTALRSVLRFSAVTERFRMSTLDWSSTDGAHPARARRIQSALEAPLVKRASLSTKPS